VVRTAKSIRNVAIYARVSTSDQSTDMQVAELRQLASARGWDVTQVIEEKRSGAKLRPAREKLIADAEAGTVDAILVWKFDRWGRSMVDLVTTVRALDEANIAFVSLKDGFDLSTSHGRLLMNLFASLAEFEREQIVERVSAGLRHAKRHGTRSGKAIGRPRTVDTRAIEIRSLASRGLSANAIAKNLGLGYGSVYRVLQASPARHK
jgi:putative DNA-invertase from lambdoid prophage Rac